MAKRDTIADCSHCGVGITADPHQDFSYIVFYDRVLFAHAGVCTDELFDRFADSARAKYRAKRK